MLDGLSDMTKKDEYRDYIKKNEHFQYPDDVMAKIKKHNPAYTKVTTSGIWESVFGRTIKHKDKGFKVEIAKNLPRWLFDISHTIGKSPPTIYQNVSGKAGHYKSILDCLMKFSAQPITFQQGAGYYSGIGQDSFVQDGKIVLRPALSEQQIIFALVREIIKHTQESDIVIEVASHIVCRHINIDTSIFTFGYLMELLEHDVSLKALKDTATQDSVIKEAEVFIGYLNANFAFLQAASSDGDVLEIDDKQESPAEQKESNKDIGNSYSVEERTETVCDIDFRFLKIIREFTNTMPDKNISMKTITEYGYYDPNMIPIGHNVAQKLFSKGSEVYRLFRDSTEAKIDNIDEISKHYGLFGISKDEWMATQAKMLESSTNTAKVHISRWNNIVAGKIDMEGGSKVIDEKSKQSSLADEPMFNADGSIVMASDDINHNSIENETWLETALPAFFKQTKYKHSDVPYFIKRQDFEITPEMKKINALMVYYCAFFITVALKDCKSKAPETGKTTYNVKKAVAIVCNTYNVKHITYAIEELWSEIKAPKAIKKAFDDYFEHIRKTLIRQPKKPTLDEQLRRLKAADEAKANAGTATEQSEQNAKSDRSIEILHIIESYNKKLTTKPKQSPKTLPIMPTEPPPAKLVR